MSTLRITPEDLASYPDLYRRNLMNTLTGFKNAHLVGTIDAKGQTNLAIFNSIIHIGANPAHMGFIMRPTTVERHTYDNIKETGYYTFNHVNISDIAPAHQTSAKYPKEKSEFEACGFTSLYSDIHPAPYVGQSSIRIGLKLKEEVFISTNQVYLIIGEVVEFFIEKDFIRADGYIDLQKAGSVAINGLDGYYEAHEITRFSYARPERDLEPIFTGPPGSTR